MKWQQVRELAANHGLEIYTPLCGYHRQAQIIDHASNRHYWTANKAIAAHQSILAIIQQRELANTPTDKIATEAEKSLSFFS